LSLPFKLANRHFTHFLSLPRMLHAPPTPSQTSLIWKF
jgi:hypothetical protein